MIFSAVLFSARISRCGVPYFWFESHWVLVVVSQVMFSSSEFERSRSEIRMFTV